MRRIKAPRTIFIAIRRITPYNDGPLNYDWLCKQRQDEASTDLCIQELSVRLGVKEEVAYFLVRNEYIASHFVKIGRHQCRRVHDASIRAFADQFIAATEVARDMNTSPKHLIERLMHKRVLPSIGPSTNGCRQVLYRRAELSEGLQSK